jgi:two-component system, chemotaxis family, chemotaxis protein CheV
METNIDKNDVYYDELISLITGNTNISSQYVIFQNCDDEYYAINVAKVEELIQNKNIDMVKSTNSDMLTLGVTKIREHLAVLVNFDDWIGTKIKPSDKLSLIILCKYSSTRLGLIVKNVIGIQSIELDSMFNGTQRDDKVAYAVQITVNGEKKLCNIFDFDQITMDIYPNIITMNQNLVEDMKIETDLVSEKKVLIAEDSILIQTHIKSLLDKMNLKYQMFDNGATLLEYLNESNPDDIGLIITDIEMPVMDGIDLLNKINESKKFKDIPLMAHTNMSNSAISTNILNLGVLSIVDKLDLSKLRSGILKYCRK